MLRTEYEYVLVRYGVLQPTAGAVPPALAVVAAAASHRNKGRDGTEAARRKAQWDWLFLIL